MEHEFEIKLSAFNAGPDAEENNRAGIIAPAPTNEVLRQIAATVQGDYAFALAGILLKAAEELEQIKVERAPIGYMAFGTYEGGWIALTDYTAKSVAGVMRKMMDVAYTEGYRGKPDDRLAELGWVIRPVFDLVDAQPESAG